MTVVIVGHGKEMTTKQTRWNFCHWIKCENGGTCRTLSPSSTVYQCQCTFGYNGVLCENKLNLSGRIYIFQKGKSSGFSFLLF